MTQAEMQTALETITQWAAEKRAQGNDPYAMTSGNGNQGLDALLQQRGISLAVFNQGAMDLGIAFTTGTTWLRAYAAALGAALGIAPAQLAPGGGGYSAGSSIGGLDPLLVIGGVALAAVFVVPRLFGRR